LLTGRYLTLEIFPFSFLEFLEFKNLSKNLDSFKEYVEFG